MTILLDLCYVLAAGLAWPWLLYRRLRRGSCGAPLRELFGRVPLRPVAGRCVWIHGVSLGEINATRTIVAELRRRAPDAVVVISSTTRTGLERARALYPRHVVFRFPADLSFAVRAALDRLRPSVIVLMELEAWPNLIALATARGIPVAIANGRITREKSMRRFGLPVVRSVARRMFGRLAFVGAQDAVYAARFVELGVRPERVEVTGSVKYDAADLSDRIDGQDELASEMGIDRAAPLLVAGSTGPGEEEILLDAFARLLRDVPDLQLAIVPRKPERFDAVAALIVRRGFACLRRSTGSPIIPVGGDPRRHVFLGDTMGELRKFYALADVAFVGRSLVPLGGSDVMEAAGLARPVLIGPHTENFAEAAELLLAAGGARLVRDADELAAQVAALLRDGDQRRAMGAAARAAIASRRGASARTVERILDLPV